MKERSRINLLMFVGHWEWGKERCFVLHVGKEESELNSWEYSRDPDAGAGLG